MNSGLKICCYTEAEWLVDLCSYLWDMLSAFPLTFSRLLQTAGSACLLLEWPIIYQLIIKGFTKSLQQRPKGQYPETSALLPLSLGGKLYVALGPWSNLSTWEASASHLWTQDTSEVCKWLSAIVWLILSRKLSVPLLTAPISSAIQPVVTTKLAVVLRWEKQVAERQWEAAAYCGLCI